MKAAAGDFSEFFSPRLVLLAVRRELQETCFSMDRILHGRMAQLVGCLGSGLRDSSEKDFLWNERSKLENARFCSEFEMIK